MYSSDHAQRKSRAIIASLLDAIMQGSSPSSDAYPNADPVNIMDVFKNRVRCLQIQECDTMDTSDLEEYARGNCAVYRPLASPHLVLKEFKTDLYHDVPADLIHYLGLVLREIYIGMQIQKVQGTLPVSGVAFSASGKVYGMVEYGGDNLLDVLYRDYNRNRRSARKLLAIFVQLTQIVFEMHQYSQVAHRDLKPANIVVNQQEVVSLIDFGASCQVDGIQEIQFHGGIDCWGGAEVASYSYYKTTCTYAPPEMLASDLSHGSYDPFKVDSWSLGMIFLSIVRSWTHSNIERVSFVDASNYKDALRDLQARWFHASADRNRMESEALGFLSATIRSSDSVHRITESWNTIRSCMNPSPDARPGARTLYETLRLMYN